MNPEDKLRTFTEHAAIQIAFVAKEKGSLLSLVVELTTFFIERIQAIFLK
jgi:hypothetical protein